MNVIELIQEGTGITKKITDLKWSFGWGPSKYWQIFDIIANLSVPTLSARSRKQITHLITIHKEYIILAILSKIANKPDYADISTSDIKLSIKKMKELGITWSELDTIQKSLDADYQQRSNLTEAPRWLSKEAPCWLSKTDDEIYNEFADELKHPHMLGLLGMVSTLIMMKEQQVFKDRPTLYIDLMSLLHESSKEILGYLDTQLKHAWCLDCITAIKRLKIFGFTAPWLITWIGDKKFPIIKCILEDIKDGLLTNPKIMIDDLHYIGVHWSELDTIMNSINAEQQKKHLREGKFVPGNRVIYTIREHVPEALEIWFYGSRARGDNKRTKGRFNRSDYDVLVLVPNSIIGNDYIELVKTLQKISKQFSNYILDIQPAHSTDQIYRIAQEEGSLLWTANKNNLIEETVNDSNYGGWIDSKNKKIIYVKHQNHIGSARKLGAIGADPYLWMYKRGYVRFITECGADNSLALEGKLEDIKATFAMWWPQARRCDALYVDIVDDHTSKSFFMRKDPQDRTKAQKLYGPSSSNLYEDIIRDDSYGGWIDTRDKKIHYAADNAEEGNAHSELARDLGAPASKLYDWMFENNYVRFVTETTPDNILSLQGKLEDIRKTFSMWWPYIRNVDDLYVETTDRKNFYFNIGGNPKSRLEAQKIFGSPNLS